MIGVLLLLMVEGIALAQAASDPEQVTLRWLRLGGLISLALLAVAWTAALLTPPSEYHLSTPGLAITAAAAVAQLMAVQVSRRTLQRLAAAATVLAAAAVGAESIWRTMSSAAAQAGLAGSAPAAAWCQAAAMALLCGGLMGGFLMAMLLGHAYLTAGNEMTQRPFARLVGLLAALIVLRLVQSGATAFRPWWGSADTVGGFDRAWTTMMIAARYLVGLAVPAVFTWMTYDCVKRRANQSATGILYVAVVLVIIGEGIGLALMGSTGRPF